MSPSQANRNAHLIKLPTAGWLQLLIACVFACLSVKAHADEPALSNASPMGDSALQELAETHPDAAFNLALRHARRDELGLATLYLERAHLWRPTDREIEDTRATVHQEIRRRRAVESSGLRIVEGEPRGIGWWRFFAAVSATTWRLMLLACVWTASILFIARRRSPRGNLRDLLGVTLAGVSIAATVAGLMWAGNLRFAHSLKPAVVIGQSPLARSAPDELDRGVRDVNLYEGAMVLILEERAGWTRVRLVDESEIWVEPETVTAVIP